MTYKEIADLGFERTDYNDQVVYNEVGVHPFFCEYKLTKNILLSFEYGDANVRLLRCDKTGTIKGELLLTKTEEVKKIIEFYTNKKPNNEKA